MPYATFTDALAQAKRAAQLRGIPFSTRDVQNLQSGYMEGAGERAAAERSSALAEESLSAQKQNWSESLAQEKELAGLSRAQAEKITRDQIDAQEKASTKAMYGSLGQTAATLGAAYLLKEAAAPAAQTAAQAALTANADAAPILADMGAEGASVYATAPTAGGTTVAGMSPGAGAGVIGAGVVGGLLTKNYAKQYTDDTGVLGFAAKQAQHPVSAGMEPVGTTLTDSGAVGKDTLLGQAFGAPAKVEEEVVGWLQDRIGCGIIMTAIHGPDSPEVNLCRKYRDKFLTDEQLRGYYVFAEPICFIMEKHPGLKRYFRKYLTDSFVDYASYRLGEKTTKPSLKSSVISRVFLRLCSYLGRKVSVYTRVNGEVY